MITAHHYLTLAFREVLPAVHAAAPSVLKREPPPPSRWPYAVRPLPQRNRPHAGAGDAVLEVGVRKRQSGCRQGKDDNINALIFLF